MENDRFKNFREELLNPLNRPKTYVTYLPYLEGEEGKRYRADVFTTLDFPLEKIVAGDKTDEAVEFAEEFLSELKPGEKSAIWLGYFIDSRYRTEKDYKPALEDADFIKGMHTVTIGGTYTMEDGELYFRRETFIVQLDEFLRKLSEVGIEPNIQTTSQELISALINRGPSILPRLQVTAKTIEFKEKSLT